MNKNSNERRSEESFKAYRTRLKRQQKAEKIWLRGRMFWNSYELGTYRYGTESK